MEIKDEDNMIQNLNSIIEKKDTVIRKCGEFIGIQSRIINKLVSERLIHIDDLTELYTFCEEELKNDK